MSPQHIVIIGAGIVGTSTAYYTAKHAQRNGAKVTLVEATGVACAASGKAGGFLAKDWHGAATSSMSALSFDLHAQLAKEFGGDAWGYRRVDALSVTLDESAKMPKKSPPVSWLPQESFISSRSLGESTTCAQVTPKLFCESLLEQFKQLPDTSFVLGRAVSLDMNGEGPKTLTIAPPSGDLEQLPADVVVMCAGPWTGQLAIDLLGDKLGERCGVTGSRAHSICLKPKERLTAHVLFTDLTMADGSVAEPEVYARPDESCYICGATDDAALPDTADLVTPDLKAIAQLHKQARAISHVFDASSGQAEVLQEQACFLPIADRGRPLIGKVRGAEGVFVNAGHSCWGITQGPGSGLLMAEMILEGKAKSADISKLAP